MKVTDLQAGEYAPWHPAYLALVDDTWTLTEEMEVSLHTFIRFVQDIPMEKHGYRYDEGKWTIKEIIQHIIDTERIFAYRALRIARGDKTPLHGFDQDAYVLATDAEARHLQTMLNELSLVRHSTIALFKSFTATEQLNMGEASGYAVSVRAIGYILVGHQNHHIKIFKERYL